MKVTIPMVLLCVLAAPRAQQTGQPNQVEQAESAELPASWHGTWIGDMSITGRAGAGAPVPIVFEIRPTADGATLIWRKTYGEGERQVVKDYRLRPRTGTADRFVLDEQNGIELDARLVGGVLFGSFQLGERCFTSRYELRDGRMTFEITMSEPSGEGTGAEGGQAVVRRAVTVVQAARLTRKRTEARERRAWVRHLAPTETEIRWRTIPWRQSLGEGLRDAGAHGSPMLLWLMNGHPLGCT